MSFEARLSSVRDCVIKVISTYENPMRRSYLFAKQAWSILTKPIKDVFNVENPYNGQKGTPNLIHPPDINIPHIPPLKIDKIDIPPLKIDKIDIPPLKIDKIDIPPLSIDFDIAETFSKMPFNVGMNYLNKQYDLNKEEQNGLPKQ